ncbi:hypothetical protein MKX01_034563 [Papaver californicum]|nr:hypothetical protein MKX01_034563 [Papaver californicum]
MSGVPKVWMRLMITFFWSFFIVFVYTGLTVGLIVLLAFIIIEPVEAREILFLFLAGIVALTYLIGLVYIGAVWNLACVISVLEKIYGLKALKKSKNLITGRIWVSSVIFVMLEISFFGILGVFSGVIIHGSSVGIFGKVVLGIFCYSLMTILIHFYLVIQTMIYFVCKSYHHENIERSGLAEHLEACYVRLGKEKDVQLEQVHV